MPEVEWEVPFPELIAMARAAEAVGFDSIWLGDHFLYDLPVGPVGPGKCGHRWPLSPRLRSESSLDRSLPQRHFMRRRCSRSRRRPLTRSPVDGSCVGIGAGWNEREYRAFGFPFDNRVSRFEEAFTIIRTLLRNGSIDFAGTYHTAERCVLHPRSSTPGGPPLMVGSASCPWPCHSPR